MADGCGSPPADAVREQLARILASEIFSRSDRLTAFLTYIVEQTLDGHGATLKEHVLAMEVYGKDADFGAAVDPIVRVDARRLRDKLREYYALAPRDAVVISVPKGSYAPVFETNDYVPATAVDAIAPAVTSRSRAWSVGAAIVVLGVCASLAISIGWRRATSKSPPLRLLTVTSFPGAEGMASLSPDGNFVVFIWRGVDPNEPNDLWVKAVDGDELTRLTNTPQFHEAMPSWSPDGRQIVFYRQEGIINRGVFLVSPFGGSERKIADRGRSPAWTPDSQSLVMTDRTADDHGIYLQVLDTGALRKLTQPPPGFSDEFPTVSPDGKTMAFARTKPPQSALFVVPMAGGEPTQLTEWRGEILHFDWTPDGREILYPQDDTSGMRIFESRPSPARRPHPSPACRSASMDSRSRVPGRTDIPRGAGYGQPDSVFVWSIWSLRHRRACSQRSRRSATQPAKTCPAASRKMAARSRSRPTATATRKSGWRAAMGPAFAA